MDMRRVAGQQHAPRAVTGRLPGRVPHPAQPRVGGLPHAEVSPGQTQRARPQLAERRRLIDRVIQRRVVDDGQPVPAAADRHHIDRPARLVQGERRSLRRVGQLDIAQDRPPGVRGPGEIDPGRGADHARGAVAARHVGGTDDRWPLGRVHVEVDAGLVLPQAGNGVLPQVGHAKLGQVLLQQFFGTPLRQEQRVGIAGGQEREVQPVLQQREMRGRHRSAFGQPAVYQPAQRELLHGARVDRERLGVRRPLRALFQDDRTHSPAVQFGREPHAYRAAADDGHVAMVHRRYE